MGHHHHNHLPPKGCMAIRVGPTEDEQERFVVPVGYLNHPLFVSLLKEAEEEFGFDHKGAITIPCRADYFRQVQGRIERDSRGGGYSHHHHQHHNHHQHLPFHLSGCFKA